MTDLAKLVVRLEAETSKYVSALEQANKKLDKFSKDTDLSLAKIAKSFAVVGIAAATGLAVLTKNAIDSADHLNDLTKSSGVSVENIQRLGFAFKQGGVDSESFATILKKLNVNIAEAAGNAKSDAAIAFKLMGISVKDAAGNVKTADQVLASLADKFEGYADGPNKVAIAVKLMGKAGEAGIPTLNEGAAALKAYGDQAEKLGLVISGQTAAAADELNDKIGALQASLFQGFGNKLAEKLIAPLSKFADVLNEDRGRMEAFNSIAGVVAVTLKGLAAAGIIITSIFQQAGRITYALIVNFKDYALGAGKLIEAQMKLMTFNFKGAAESFRSAVGSFKDGSGEIGSALSDVAGNVSNDFNKIRALFSDGSEGLLEEVKVSVKKIKAEAPSIAAAKVTGAEVEAAIKKLKDFNDKLKEQVGTFGLGEVASIKYRLSIGDLSDEVKKAGVEGKKLADSILQQTIELEKLRNVDAVTGLDNQILQLTGHLKEAALATFDLSNKSLKASFTEAGDKKGLDALETLRKLTSAQAEYTDLQKDAQKIQEQLARSEQQIQNSMLVGANTDLTALEKTGAARADAVKQLDEIHKKMAIIADDSGNPDLVDGAKKFGAEIDDLRSKVDLLGQKAEAVFEDAFGGAFADFITGAKSAGDAIKGFFQDLEREAAAAIAKNFAQQIFGGLFTGANSSSSGSGFMSSLGSIAGALFGGGKAGGGGVQAGMAYKINEATPKSEYFIPGMNGRVVPAGQMGGASVTNNFTIQAPKGTVPRQTERQIAATVAVSVLSANRRNN